MSTYDFSAPRLYLDAPLGPNAEIAPERDQSNYLLNVLRLGDGDEILAFNGRDGEWRARIDEAARKSCRLVVDGLLRAQRAEADLWLLFAPLKKARTDYLAEKATESCCGTESDCCCATKGN